MLQLGQRHVEVEAAVCGGLPGIAPGAVGGAAGRAYDRVRVIRRIQLGQRHRGLSPATGAGARQNTGRAGGGSRGNGVAEIMIQFFNRLRFGFAAIDTGIGFYSSYCAAWRCSNLTGIPLMFSVW